MEVKRLEELYDGVRGLRTLSEKLNNCTIELKWAYVNEIEQVSVLQLLLYLDDLVKHMLYS